MSARAKRKPFVVVLTQHPKTFLWGSRDAVYFAKRCRKFRTVEEAQSAIDSLRRVIPLPYAHVARLVTPESDPPKLEGNTCTIVADDVELA